MSKKSIIVLLLVVIMAVPMRVSAQDSAGCAAGVVAEDAPVIKLGAAVSLTGNFEVEGNDLANGYVLWQEWVNGEHGGINVGGVCHQVELVLYDDESDKEKVAALITQLITEDQVNFLLGPYSSTLVGPASDVSDPAGVLMVQAGGASEALFQKGYQNLFGVLTPGGLYTQSGIELAASLGATTAVIAYEDSAFSTSVAAGAEQWLAENGIELLAKESYPTGSTDLTDLLTGFSELEPDLFIGGGDFNGSVLFIQTAKAVGFNPDAYLITVAPSNPEFVAQLGADAEGVWGASQWESSMAWEDGWFGTAGDYATRYETRFGAPPSYIAAQGTAAAVALQLAIEAAGSLETDAVRTALQDLDAMTFFGPINFDDTGSNSGKPMATVQILGGAVLVIAPEAAAVADATYPVPVWADR